MQGLNTWVGAGQGSLRIFLHIFLSFSFLLQMLSALVVKFSEEWKLVKLAGTLDLAGIRAHGSLDIKNAA